MATISPFRVNNGLEVNANANVVNYVTANSYIQSTITRPSVGATFSADFLNTGRLDSRIRFTRSTTATYYDSSGTLESAGINVPRFDYDPVTKQPLGLLMERTKTNFIRNNMMIGASVSNLSNLTGTLPSLWTTAIASPVSSKIVGLGIESGINYIDIEYYNPGAQSVTQGLFYPDSRTGTNGLSYTGSVFLKVVSGTCPPLFWKWQDGTTTYNDTATFTPTSTLIRYTNSYTLTGTTLRWVLSADFSGAETTFVIRVGLPQVEDGVDVSSPILTSGSEVSRGREVALISDANFNSWYNQTQGTIITQWKLGSFKRSASIWMFSDNEGQLGNDTNWIRLRYGASGIQNDVAVASSNAVIVQLSTAAQHTSNTVYKTGFAYDTNDFSRVNDGGAAVTDIDGTPPAVDRFFIGSGRQSDEQPSCWIQRITYYPVRFLDTIMQEMTL